MRNILIISLCLFSLSGCAPYRTVFKERQGDKMIAVAEIRQDVIGKASYKQGDKEFSVDTQQRSWTTNVAEQVSKLLILKEISG